MDTQERFEKAREVCQEGKSTYDSAIERVNEVQKEKEDLNKQSKALNDEAKKTNDEQVKAESEARRCAREISAIESQLSDLRSQQRSSEDDGNDYLESRISYLEDQKDSLELEKREHEAEVKKCQEIFVSIAKDMQVIRDKLEECGEQLEKVKSECEAVIPKLDDTLKDMRSLSMQLQTTSGVMGRIQNGLGAKGHGSQAAAPGYEWTSSDAKKANDVANWVNNCIKALQGVVDQLSSASDSDEPAMGGNRRRNIDYDER